MSFLTGIMALFVILLLCATAVLGTDLNDDNQRQGGNRDSHTIFPIDYFDDIFNSDLKIKPESMFSYNFEQTRRDQPPQLVMREENVGRYFHVRPTTTTPGSIFSMKAESEAQHVYPNLSPRNDYNRNDKSIDELSKDDIYKNENERNSWSEPQKSAVPPPPKFAFSKHHSEPSRALQSTQYYNQPAVVEHPQNEYTHNARRFQPHPTHIETTTQQAMKRTEHLYFTNHNMFVPTPAAPHVSPLAKESEIGFAPSASYVSDSINENRHMLRHNVPRGHRKYSDLGAMERNDMKINHERIAPVDNHHVYIPQTSTTVQPSPVYATNNNKVPPPVPTLSPWYDGFGK